MISCRCISCRCKRAENGSEYPESRQSESTTASKQLALEQLLDRLSSGKPPQLVIIVVATDVRDRLFLFDKLRERLPRAMFVDLDADNLVAHHTYLHASRGALAWSGGVIGLLLGLGLHP
jgi:hypothetical protein